MNYECLEDFEVNSEIVSVLLQEVYGQLIAWEDIVSWDFRDCHVE